MAISNLSIDERISLSTHHRNHESLSYRMSALLVLTYLVASVALLFLLGSLIYAHSTGKKLYLKVALPAVTSLVATIPFIIFGGIKELKHRKTKKQLLETMKSHLLPYYKEHSKKELMRFINENLLQDWNLYWDRGIRIENEHYKEWHRTYRGYLITQLKEAFKGEEENKTLIEALGELEKDQTKELEGLAPVEE